MSRRLKKQQRRKADIIKGGNSSSAAPVAISGAQGVQPSSPTVGNGVLYKPSRQNWAVAGICVSLVLLVFIVFGQTLGHGFINYDDDKYVYDNAMVSKGLSFNGV